VLGCFREKDLIVRKGRKEGRKEGKKEGRKEKERK
jgi:hypothetical protein